MMRYLPAVTEEQLRRCLLDPDSEFLTMLDSQEYERLGLDRALLIAADILLRTGKIENYSILDVGCNSGLIGRALGVFGNCVTGIDNDAVAVQGCYEALDGVCKADFREYLLQDKSAWDFVLLLSVAHHWETGYAMKGAPMYSEAQIHWIFAELRRRVHCGIYLELPLNEPGFQPVFSDDFVRKYASAFSVSEINRTVGTNGFQRRLFYLDAGGENRNVLLEKLLRNAHLYEKLEAARLTAPRAELFRLREQLRSSGIEK